MTVMWLRLTVDPTKTEVHSYEGVDLDGPWLELDPDDEVTAYIEYRGPSAYSVGWGRTRND
jgi:hypothetical protein